MIANMARLYTHSPRSVNTKHTDKPRLCGLCPYAYVLCPLADSGIHARKARSSVRFFV